MAEQATLNLCTSVFGLHPSSEDETRTAVVIFPGVQSTRISEAPWQDYSKTVWVAGTRGDPAYTSAQIMEYLMREGDLFPLTVRMQLNAKHTPEQALWVVQLLLRNVHVEQVVLSTAKYHTPRALLTLLKSWLTHGDERKLRLSVLPTSDPTEEEKSSVTETSTSLEAELLRIEHYQALGDVATKDEFYTFVQSNHGP